ncbi:hypothetical protein IE4803_CH03231 [Rhizobium etli bv. phaseoli str. IE4803]|nr:hypothetical protein IE4803_CH03231 [Rhizobium etli bv. phaseoli str. IE4803]
MALEAPEEVQGRLQSLPTSWTVNMAQRRIGRLEGRQDLVLTPSSNTPSAEASK